MGKLRTLTAESLKEPWEVVCDGVVIAHLVPSVPSSQTKQVERAAYVPTSQVMPLSKERQASKKGFNA